MISFSQFLSEARMAPLYHGTPLRLFNEIMNSGVEARTYHYDHVVGKAAHKIDHLGRLSRKDTTGSAFSTPRVHGISTTRRYKFAKNWLDKTLEEPGAIIEFDQQKLAHRYKLVPVNFYGWGAANRTRALNDNHATNEFEEFIVMKQGESLPWNMVTQIHLPVNEEGGNIDAWAKKKGIKVTFDPNLRGRNY